MKNLFIFSAMFFLACSAGKEQEDPKPVNELLQTIWEANDPFADIIWGGTNRQYYEFLSDTEVQYHQTHNGTVKNMVKGTYLYTKPALTMQIDGDTEQFEISGSLMVSKTQMIPSGGFLTYTRQ